MNKEIKLKRIVKIEEGFVNKILWLLVSLLLIILAFQILNNVPSWKVLISFMLVMIGTTIIQHRELPKIDITYKVVK